MSPAGSVTISDSIGMSTVLKVVNLVGDSNLGYANCQIAYRTQYANPIQRYASEDDRDPASVTAAELAYQIVDEGQRGACIFGDCKSRLLF